MLGKKTNEIQDLILKAKEKIDENVEFHQANEDYEYEMITKGIPTLYDFSQNIIYYSLVILANQNEKYQNQAFVHELAHVKDLRCCIENGLLKHFNTSRPDWKLDDSIRILHQATEFQVSNYLYSKFGYQLPKTQKVIQDLNENSIYSLIPGIEYLLFGEDLKLRDLFECKLNEKYGKTWSTIESLLNTLSFADPFVFETEFLRLADCFGYIIQTEPITKDVREIFKILQEDKYPDVKIFKLMAFDVKHSIFKKSIVII